MKPKPASEHRTVECPHCHETATGTRADVGAWILEHRQACPVRHHPTQLIGTIREDGRDWHLYADDVSGHCGAGRHAGCAHRQGGQQEHGVYHPASEHLPAYTWRCGCYCHTGARDAEPAVLQLELFPALGDAA